MMRTVKAETPMIIQVKNGIVSVLVIIPAPA